jgi:hypothetical protein
MADYTGCRRGEKFPLLGGAGVGYAPTILYAMQQTPPSIQKTPRYSFN